MNIRIELHYLPCVHWFSNIYQFDKLVIDDLERYERQSYRNRCYIAGANGKLPLIIPVQDRGKAAGIREVRIANDGMWQRIHWQGLQSAYGRTPFFEYYEGELKPFYERRAGFLFDYTYDLLQVLVKLLRLDAGKITLASENGACPEVNYKDRIHPKKSPETDGAFQPWRYFQPFEDRHGFLPNLSIADVLFNLGPDSAAYIRSCVKQ